MRAIRETRPSSTTSPRLVKLAALFHCFAARYKNTQQKLSDSKVFFGLARGYLLAIAAIFIAPPTATFAIEFRRVIFHSRELFIHMKRGECTSWIYFARLSFRKGSLCEERRGEKNSVIMQMPRVSSLRGEKMLIHDAPDYSSSMHKLPHKVTGGGG